MAKQAAYRPAAPRDSIGIIQLSDEEMASPVRLAKEAHEYAESFLTENPVFWIGFPVITELDPISEYDTNRAFVYAIEAARMLADGVGGRKTAAKLLEMALLDVKEVEE